MTTTTTDTNTEAFWLERDEWYTRLLAECEARGDDPKVIAEVRATRDVVRSYAAEAAARTT